MVKINYSELKFKAGIEVHQQLESSKLFCNCPSILRTDEPSFEVSRRLHAVAGESGEVDIAAAHESSLGKEFIYQAYDTTCLIELDEEPPHEINQDALRIGMQIGLLLNCKILPISQIMRKTVIDGSNTSGFQRTVVIAQKGFIETSLGNVGIDWVYLEEDAARAVSRSDERVVYKLDRLGIPLVEIVTAPDLKDAEHAKEVALKIGEILRSCKVRRGIGTIRQDINISIRGENRVEIKGMQDMDVFLNAVETEILRQKALSDTKKPTAMEVRNVLKDGTSEFLRPLPGHARMYPETDLPLLKIHKAMIDEVKKNLPKLKSDVEEDLRKKGLTEDMIKILFKRNKLNDFRELYDAYGNALLIGKLLFMIPSEFASKNNKSLEEVEEIFNVDVLSIILDRVSKDKLHQADIKFILEKVFDGEGIREAVKVKKEDNKKIEERVMKIVKEKPGLNANAYMGLVMKEFRGKVTGGDAMEMIKKFVK